MSERATGTGQRSRGSVFSSSSCDEKQVRLLRPRTPKSVLCKAFVCRSDRPALRALPAERFAYGEWKSVKVNIDYHVEYDHHYYSVSYTLLGAELDVRATRTTVEIYRGTERLTSHVRSHLTNPPSLRSDHDDPE